MAVDRLVTLLVVTPFMLVCRPETAVESVLTLVAIVVICWALAAVCTPKVVCAAERLATAVEVKLDSAARAVEVEVERLVRPEAVAVDRLTVALDVDALTRVTRLD